MAANFPDDGSAFTTLHQDAQAWVREQAEPRFHFVTVIEEDKKLIFSLCNGGGTFFVTLEGGAEEMEWVVWSEDKDVIPQLLPLQEYIKSCSKKTIRDILDKINLKFENFTPSPGSSGARPDLADKREDHDSANDSDSDYRDDVEDDDDGCFADEDLDVQNDAAPEESPEMEASAHYFTGNGSRLAVLRLMKDLKNLKECGGSFGLEGEPRGDDLFVWDVKLKDFPSSTPLGQDLIDYAKKYERDPVIYLEMRFPANYPMSPPFVRILRPRFRFLTGHVTIGGSICMELLTMSGWTPTNEIESILVQIRSEIMSDENARLDARFPDKAYDGTEARQAFDRMVQRYGWNK